MTVQSLRCSSFPPCLCNNGHSNPNQRASHPPVAYCIELVIFVALILSHLRFTLGSRGKPSKNFGRPHPTSEAAKACDFLPKKRNLSVVPVNFAYQNGASDLF